MLDRRGKKYNPLSSVVSATATGGTIVYESQAAVTVPREVGVWGIELTLSIENPDNVANWVVVGKSSVGERVSPHNTYLSYVQRDANTVSKTLAWRFPDEAPLSLQPDEQIAAFSSTTSPNTTFFLNLSVKYCYL